MTIPSYETMLNPMIKVLALAGEDMPGARLIEALNSELKLSSEDLALQMPSGSASVFAHRVEWARCYLQMQGLVEGSTARGLRLSDRGWERALHLYPELGRGHVSPPSPATLVRKAKVNAEDIHFGATNFLGLRLQDTLEIPDQSETIAQIRQLNDELGIALINRVCRQSPEFFEHLILDLLIAMGYGKGRQDVTRQLGRTGDGGVDGVVAIDELGLDPVYFQAKRYRPDIPVPVAAVRDFVGALDARRAARGIFFTTSFFPTSAREYVSQSTFRLVLIDGVRLSLLMMRHNIGVRIKDEIKIKRIDESYFAA